MPTPHLSYETFELLIGSRTADGYPVTVLESLSGDASAFSLLAPEDPGLRQALDALETRRTDSALLQQLGQHLFQELFVGDVESRYRTSLGIARSQDRGLRIRLRIEAPELAALPWEYLYDPAEDAFLAISAQTALVRYVPMGGQPRALQVSPPLRVQVVISNPTDVEPLDVDKERQTIQDALQRWIELGVIELQIVDQATVPRVAEALRSFRPHVFHFVGHGAFIDDQAYLILEHEDGTAATIDDTTFRELFTGIDDTRIAVLNACETATTSSVLPLVGLAPRLLQRQLSGVVAMQFPVTDRAALIFTREFYRSLALGQAMETAVAESRRAIFVELGKEGPDWGAPVLFLRTEGGQLWQVDIPEDVAKKVANVHFHGDVFVIPRLPLMIAAIALVIILGFVSYRVVAPAPSPTPPPTGTAVPSPTPTATPVPGKMTGAFKVAVAQFGALDENQQVTPNEEAAQLSGWLYQTLEREYRDQLDIPGLELWHDSPQLQEEQHVIIGLVEGNDEPARTSAAEAMAHRLNADVVIYGYLAPGGNPRDLILDFYISPDLEFSPDLSRDIDPVVGRHRLGSPIPVQLPLSTLAGLEANERLSVRTKALAWLTIGLAFDLVNPTRALEIFHQAEERLQDWPDEHGSGKEILYFFIGQEELLLGNDDSAEDYFRKALAIEPQYARSLIGLGSVFFNRSQKLSPAERLNTDFIQQAIENFDQARQAAPDSPWPPTEEIALTALGLAYRLQGETFNALDRFDESDQAFDQAADVLNQAIALLETGNQPRFLAHAYLSLGATYQAQANLRLRQGQTDDGVAFLTRALASYQQCIAQANAAPLDKVLTQYYVDERCKPYQAQVQKDLVSLGGGQG
jgi:tetratricopeptide (TPR) repeat protein